MKDAVLKLILNLVAKYLSPEKIEELAAAFKAAVLPKLAAYKNELIAQLRAEAGKSETSLDDKAVDAIDIFLSALLPKA